MNYIKCTDWQSTPEGQNLFPSAASLAWYLRLHRHVLVQDGLIMKLRNVWRVDADRFEKWVLEEGRRHTEEVYAEPISMNFEMAADALRKEIGDGAPIPSKDLSIEDPKGLWKLFDEEGILGVVLRDGLAISFRNIDSGVAL